MVASPTRSIVARGLQSRAGRTVRALLQRLPVRVQRFGLRALTPVAKRWPTLVTLLGLAPSPPPGTGPRAAREEPPRPVAGPTQPRSEAFIRRLRTDPDPVERGRAARALGERSGPEVTSALVDALRDPGAEVAAEAAEALARHPAPRVVTALRGVVENADGFFNTAVRAAAIRSLTTLLPAGEGAPIVNAVADVDAEVSIAAIAGLVDRKEAAGTEALLGVVENPRGFYLDLTRGAAARGLRLLTPAQTARLRTVLAGEPEGALRELLIDLLRSEEAPRGQA